MNLSEQPRRRLSSASEPDTQRTLRHRRADRVVVSLSHVVNQIVTLDGNELGLPGKRHCLVWPEPDHQGCFNATTVSWCGFMKRGRRRPDARTGSVSQLTRGGCDERNSILTTEAQGHIDLLWSRVEAVADLKPAAAFHRLGPDDYPAFTNDS